MAEVVEQSKAKGLRYVLETWHEKGRFPEVPEDLASLPLSSVRGLPGEEKLKAALTRCKLKAGQSPEDIEASWGTEDQDDDAGLDLEGADADGLPTVVSVQDEQSTDQHETSTTEDELDLGDFGSLDPLPDVPALVVSSASWREILRLGTKLISSSARDFAAKSLHLSHEDGQLVARATDVNITFEVRLPLVMGDGMQVMEDPLVVPLETLRTVSQLLPSRVALLQLEDGPEIQLLGGTMPLESYQVSVERYTTAGEQWQKVGEVDAEALAAVIDAKLPMISATINAAERRIIISRGTAYSTYMYAIEATELDCPDFDLRIVDAVNLQAILQGRKGKITIEHSIPPTIDDVTYVAISGEDFRYVTLYSECKVPASMREMMAEEVKADGVAVDTELLFRYVKLAEELPHSTGRLGLNFDQKGSLQVILRVRKGAERVFTMDGAVSGEPKPLKEMTLVQANYLRFLVAAMRGQGSTKVSVSRRGIGLESGNTQAALFVRMD